MSNFYLTLLTLIPLAGAIFVALLADKRALIRAGGLGFSFATLAATLALNTTGRRAACNSSNSATGFPRCTSNTSWVRTV